MQRKHRVEYLSFAALCSICVGLLAGGGTAFADDEARNAAARKDCVRGKFQDYYLQGRGGDPAPDYKGRTYKLSQNYPSQLPPKEAYPWLKIEFNNGGPVDPRAYLQALLEYGIEGNVSRSTSTSRTIKSAKWYGMPWMDWNTEVASDWPGTDVDANSFTA